MCKFVHVYARGFISYVYRRRRSLPQSRSYSGCGKQGVHVLLTKEFLTDDSVDPYTNNSGKTLHSRRDFKIFVSTHYITYPQSDRKQAEVPISQQARDVAMTSHHRHFGVMCPLGRHTFLSHLKQGGKSCGLNDRVQGISCRYSDKTCKKINYISTNTYSIIMQ